jgi:gamma-butyrobetaine dioxygenase
MIAVQEFDAAGVTAVDAGGTPHRLTQPDLLALAEEGRDPRSLQRVPGFLRPRGDLTACDAIGHGWRLAFADGSAITIAAARLAALLAAGTTPVPRQVWRGTDPALPVHGWQAVMTDPGACLACLRQVLSHGYARLSGAPVEPGTVTRFLAHFGLVRETNYGMLFDVRVRPDPGNLADSALALLPHTDNPYRATPPDLQVLHALVAAADGGETWLVDGQAVIDHLRANAPDALVLLTQVPVRFGWRDANWHLETVEPAVTLAPDGTLARLRTNSRSLDAPIEPDAERRAAWWAAWNHLETCLGDRAFAQTFALGAGELVIMDNRRVLHGRTGFSGGAGERHLQGAYADIDGLASHVLRLAEARARGAVEGLGALFQGAAMDGRYGEAISIRDHMLQSAELATAQGLGDHGIAAALLHDIGWAPAIGDPAHHEHAAATRLQAIFGPRVADPVRWHVEAKRYLVARHPEYHDRLSAASIETLRHQGGPMTEAECAQFEQRPDHALYLAIRAIDDAGKETAPPRTAWADYEPLLTRLALRYALES